MSALIYFTDRNDEFPGTDLNAALYYNNVKLCFNHDLNVRSYSPYLAIVERLSKLTFEHQLSSVLSLAAGFDSAFDFRRRKVGLLWVFREPDHAVA